MKKGNIYKVMIVMISLVLISAMSFAQEGKKELKKKNQHITINIEMDEDGNTTSIDTIIVINGDLKQELKDIIVEVEEIMIENSDDLKELRVEILANMDEVKDVYCVKLSENKDEIERALSDLNKELENLEIEKEVRERIEQSMETLEGVDWQSHALSLEHALVDAHEMHFGNETHETVKVFIEDGDTTEIRTKVLFIGDEGKASSDQEMNVWVTDDGEKKIIIKKSGSGNSDENIMILKDGAHHSGSSKMMIMKADGDADFNMLMLKTADENDIKKAKNAGIDISEDNRLEINNVNLEIENDDTKISLKTTENGKMKVSLLDHDFKKIKQIKAKEESGSHVFPLDLKEITGKEHKAKYLLIEQNNKLELMTL